MAPKKIVVVGASGTIGSHLVPFLKAKGYEVLTPKREDLLLLDGVEAVINLAGAPILQASKDKILKSRIDSTRRVVAAINRASPRPKLFINASAVGFYGNTGERIVTEAGPQGSGFLADVCHQWEEEAQKAEGSRVVLLRMSMVLSPNAKIVKAFRMGLGARLGSGEQWMSFIDIDDLLAAVEHAIQHEELQGPINLSSPNFLQNKDFTKALAKSLHRPAFFAIPAWFLRLALGKLADETVLTSQKIYPQKLLDSGFIFSKSPP